MKKFILVVLANLLFIVSCSAQERSPIQIDMYNADGDSIGTATLSEQVDGVKMKASVEGLEPGLHGIHVHEFPKCEGPDFKSAGNHLNPQGKEHGLMHPKGAHLGDLPNIEVGADGTAEVDLTVNGATLLEGKNSLLKNDGSSLVIHEKQDDGASQPAGESGQRVACGTISLSESNNSQSPTDPTQSNEEEE
ncbi:superoxide dismutase family protein [Aquibacillus salsiterrae]|uniref:Superoxide dismutase family protein n=1 Tax=Aquibacillus salsiterrae TaxID=2950439 RepID=A0A9X3WH32_9BACI|nr:superoxide dismutase family protein [Aquibacillus salsiterrae]MDC3418296.1 superoxide dismutase family protein [Aquibacillus salsiterrae]